MPNSSLPTIGFERFVRLEWANYALTLAMMDKPSIDLRSWLNERIPGKDSARKTMNVLANMWFTRYEQTDFLRIQGLHLARSQIKASKIVFHWGMCLANFPLFWQTVYTIGRFILLQNTFHKADIKSRLGEQYHNQVSVNRSVERILQSFLDWQVLEPVEGNRLQSGNKIAIQDHTIVKWLFMTALITSDIQPVQVLDFIRSPVFFPFDFEGHGLTVLHNSDEFIWIREGVDKELVRLTISK